MPWEVQALLAELDPRLLIPGAAGMLPAFHNDLAAPNPPPALHQPPPALVEQDANVAAWRVSLSLVYAVSNMVCLANCTI